MNLQRKKISQLVAATLTLVICSSVLAQAPADVNPVTRNFFAPTTASALPEAPSASSGYQVSQYPTGNTSGDWRVGISFYGWFPGVHGTVGVLGHNASIHVPFSDTFHLLKGIIPVAVEADRGRFLMPVDFLWMKLGVNNAIPLNDHGQTSIDTHLTESIFTPKFGYRLLDADHLKFDALAGIRYWHVGINNTLVPSGVSYSQSANWVDGLGGGRFILPFGEKAAVTAAGDAGAGQANLDYQVVGLLNYNFTPKLGMAVGWRYLYENFRPNNSSLFVFNPTTSGAVAGLSFNIGGKPPAPPSLSCAASPSPIYPGDPVTVTVTPAELDPKLNALYTWSGDGVSGNGTTATVDTSKLNPGAHTVRVDLKEGKPGKEGLKPWQNASCSVAYTLNQFQPPTVSCSTSPSELRPGDSSTVTARGVSPQNRPLTYSYQASGGTITGEGGTATFSSRSAPAGPVQINCNVVDDKGHSATATTSVNIAAPPPPPPPPPSLLLHSVFFPTALPNEKRPDKGLATSQEKILTTLATDFKAYLQVKPDARLTLTGHADPRGGAKYNQALTERRVGSAKNFLVQQGVPESLIDTVALGDTHLLSKDEVKQLVQTNPDLTEEERAKILRNINQIYLAQNRRVDITLANTGQQSVQVYPFNAHDAATLLSEKPQAHARKPTAPKK